MASSFRNCEKSEGFVEGFAEKLDECESMEGVVDRFSGLPDKIVHKVLSSLNVADLAQLMQVSHKCFDLCMTVPVLLVSNWKYTCDADSLNHYTHLVGNYLSNRCKEKKKVRRLNFIWNWAFVEEIEENKKRKRDATKKVKKEKVVLNSHVFRVHQFYSTTVSCCDAESLHLYLISPKCKPQELPAFFFDSGSDTKEITVRTNNCRLGFFIFPDPSSSKVEKLTLWSCVLDDTQLSRVVSMLPSLKSFWLHDCQGLSSLVLDSSSLERITIYNEKVVGLQHLRIYCDQLQTLSVYWFPHPDCRTAFMIHSKQLKEFVWHGFPLGYYYNENTVHLEKASIQLLLPNDDAPWDLSRTSVDLLEDLIDQLKVAKHVTFHSATMRFFYMEDCLLSPLSKIESLAIECCTLIDKQVPVVAFTLQELVDLKSLSIRSCVSREKVQKVLDRFAVSGLQGFDVEFWETKDLKFVHQLKKATIEAPCGNAVELVKYLLKHGRALETMNILCFPGMEESISEQIKEYATHSTTIVFSSM